MRHLAACCDAEQCTATSESNAKSASQFGMRLGIQCAFCCASFMIILLVIGVMDIRLMAILAVAIAIEKLWPQQRRIAIAFGILMISAGIVTLIKMFSPLL